MKLPRDHIECTAPPGADQAVNPLGNKQPVASSADRVEPHRMPTIPGIISTEADPLLRWADDGGSTRD